MTTFIEEQLTEAMHERVGDIALPDDLVGRTLRRQHRRTMMRRTAYAAGGIGVAGVLTVGAFALANTSPSIAHNPHAVAGDGSPRVRLVAAVSESRGTSYRVTNTITVRSEPGSPSFTVEGAFDPTSFTGFSRTSDGGASWHEERLVGGDLYVMDVIDGQALPWTTDGSKHTSLPYGDKTGLPAVTADPMQFLGVLTNSGATITRTGPKTYHFTAPIVLARKTLGEVEGDVTLDSNERIANVVYEAALHGTPTDNTVLDGTLALSDYGAPVTVERPGGTFEQLPGKPSPEPKPVG